MIQILKYTLIEQMRGKIYFSALGLLFLILGISWMGSSINYNFGEFHRTILAFGMNMTQLLVVAMSLFLPVSHLSLEYERGTAQVLWSKLRSRSEYYTGKFGAFLMLMFTLILLSSLFIGVLAYLNGATVNSLIFLSYFVFGLFCESACIISLCFFLYALLFSSGLSSLLGLLILYCSIFLETAKEISVEAANPFIKAFYASLYFLFPKLGYFNFENHIIYQKQVSFTYLFASGLYAFLFSLALLGLANVFLKKREV